MALASEQTLDQAFKKLRTVQFAMLGSIVLFAVAGELAFRSAASPNPSIHYAFSTVAVAIVGMVFVVRRTMVVRSAESLATRPDDGISLQQWFTGYIVTYTLCEALPVFGFALRFVGFTLQQSLLFYVSGFVLIFFFAPRLPLPAASLNNQDLERSSNVVLKQ